MFGRFPKQQPRFAPGPYATTVQIPWEMRSLPFVFVRAHAWPKQDVALMHEDVSNPRADRIAYGTVFLNAEQHPFRDPVVGAQAIHQARAQLSNFQRTVIQKYVSGMPLTYTEARELFATTYTGTAPRFPNWAQINRAAAQAADVKTYAARQISYYPASGIPPAVARMRAALSNPYTRIINERAIISRNQEAADLMSKQMRCVVGASVINPRYR